MAEHENRVFTNKGLPKDVEENVLLLCRQAFNSEDYLMFSDRAPQEYKAQDIMKARIATLPVLYAWAEEVLEDANQTGASLGRTQREELTFRVTVVYATDYALAQDGNDIVKEVGWHLREKLAENTNLNGIANAGGKIVGLNFMPELVMQADRLVIADAARIVMEYKTVRKRKRAS